MRIHHLLILVIACLGLSRCKNENVKPVYIKPVATQLLLGKWSLVKDSTYSWFPTTDTLAHIKRYSGTTGDYYDFRNDGKCYIKVAGVYDTLAYQITISNEVILQKFGINVNG